MKRLLMAARSLDKFSSIEYICVELTDEARAYIRDMVDFIREAAATAHFNFIEFSYDWVISKAGGRVWVISKLQDDMRPLGGRTSEVPNIELPDDMHFDANTEHEGFHNCNIRLAPDGFQWHILTLRSESAPVFTLRQPWFVLDD